MKVIQKSLPRLNMGLQHGARWLLALTLSICMTACADRLGSIFATESPAANAAINSSSANPQGTSMGRMGTEEFGLSKQELVETIEQVERLIAQCMSEAGFEYIAVDYNTARRGMVADKSLPGYSEEQFAREFGFGIATLYTGKPPQLSEFDTPARIGLGEQNARIFANLSATDQVAYSRTLFGENPDATFAVSLEAENFSLTSGCTRKAIEQVFSPEELSTTYLNPYDAIRQQDPNMARVFKQFADCMRTHGFNYSREQEIEPDLKKRLYAITDGAPIEALSTEAQAALQQLQGEEIAIAAALFECGEP
jgi:hypothetical protein